MPYISIYIRITANYSSFQGPFSETSVISISKWLNFKGFLINSCKYLKYRLFYILDRGVELIFQRQRREFYKSIDILSYYS